MMRRLLAAMTSLIRWRTQAVVRPARVSIDKAKWFGHASSPVLFMIDDLTNSWVERNGRELDGPDYDWGGKHRAANGVVRFLEDRLFRRFPQIKTTYFTVVGEMSPFSTQATFASAKPMNSDTASAEFFRSLGRSSTTELAYHGLTHGIPRERPADFVQEWESFQTLEAGLAQIEKGKAIYREVMGHEPEGGKYGGYRTNHLSERTVEHSGFLWWCRDWTPRDTTGAVPDQCYEVAYFGEKRKVVSIPSTVHGRHWTRAQIDRLLRHGQVISVQEHISPRRPDGRTQTPNIYDDIDALSRLFTYLATQPVWYATASEVARYFIGYTHSLFFDLQHDTFRVEYTGGVPAPVLTIWLDASSLCDPQHPSLQIVLPGGQHLAAHHVAATDRPYLFSVNLPLQSGRYALLSATVDNAETP
jgi:hypothetical protein